VTRGNSEEEPVDLVVLARSPEDAVTAIGPVSTDAAADQIREQAEQRGWAYLGTAVAITAAEFRQPSQEAET
jgi:hypothetical protein